MFNPTKFKGHYRIPSNRLSGYDYSQTGLYFITVCTKDRFPYFGNIKEGQMDLSEIGEVIKEELLRTVEIRPNVNIDEWVIMPNHIHVIVGIDHETNVADGVETHCNASLQMSPVPQTSEYRNTFGPQRNNLSSIIRGFKSVTTKRINLKFGEHHFSWQPRFHDHIIRNEHSLQRIRQYILDNPMKWVEDELFVK